MKTTQLSTIIALIILCSGCGVSKKVFVQYQTEMNNTLSFVNQQIGEIKKNQADMLNTLNNVKSKQLQNEKETKQNISDIDSQMTSINDQITNLNKSNDIIKQKLYDIIVSLNKKTNFEAEFNNYYFIEYEYLTTEERAVFYYLNFARTDPKRFVEKCVMKDKQYNYYYPERKESLIETLKEMEPVGEILPDKDLYLMAYCYAKKGGELGIRGHDRSQTGCEKGYYGECCSYGHQSGLEIVMQLLVDPGENNAALGHRKMCLGKSYSKLGVSIQPHKEHSFHAVLDFK